MEVGVKQEVMTRPTVSSVTQRDASTARHEPPAASRHATNSSSYPHHHRHEPIERMMSKSRVKFLYENNGWIYLFKERSTSLGRLDERDLQVWQP